MLPGSEDGNNAVHSTPEAETPSNINEKKTSRSFLEVIRKVLSRLLTNHPSCEWSACCQSVNQY